MISRLQRPTPGSKWRITLLVTGTTVVGLAIGVALGLLAENKPFEQRSTAHLIRDLQKKDSPLDRLRQKLWPVLPNSVTERLSHFTPMAADVVRQLAAVELRRRAPAGPEAVPALVRALHDPHSGVRGMALQALAGFGPGASPAVPDIIPMLEMAGNPVLRSEAARTLVAIAPENPQVRTQLLAIVRDRPPPLTDQGMAARKRNASQEALRNAVLRVLDKLPRPEEQIVPLLLSELAMADEETAVEIVGTLQRIGPVTPEVIPALVTRLKRAQSDQGALEVGIDPRGPQRRAEIVAAILRALQRLARADNDVVSSLIATLPESDAFLTARIVQTLGFIGPLRDEVVPTVIAALRSNNPQVQLSAIRALGMMGGRAAPAIPEMIRLLQAQRGHITTEPLGLRPADPRRRRAGLSVEFDPAGSRLMNFADRMALQLMQSLARFGPLAQSAVPAILEMMSESKNELRYEAAVAAWQIDRTNDLAKAVLVEALNIPDPDVPRRLVRHFRNMGPGEVSILSAAVDHLDAEVRLAAFSVVSALAVEQEAAVLVLERLADESANPLRDRALRALESIHAKGPQSSNQTTPATPPRAAGAK